MESLNTLVIVCISQISLSVDSSDSKNNQLEKRLAVALYWEMELFCLFVLYIETGKHGVGFEKSE